MKVLVKLFFVVFLVLTVSCKKDTNPVSLQSEMIPSGGCSTEGIDIVFVDSCSYDFAIAFLSDFDSVQIVETYFGINLYLYADSGDANYWINYFSEDSSFLDLSFSTLSDSLFLKFRFLNEEVYLEEKDHLIDQKNLIYQKSVQENKTVFINVPEGSESEWVTYFKKFDFIEYVFWIAICYNNIS